MYFPYLRGKQYELLALRDLVSLPLDKDKIIPIVEPVKSLKSVTTALEMLKPIDVRIQLLVNPMYGDFVNKSDEVIKFIEESASRGQDNIIPTFLVNDDKDVDFIIKACDENGFNNTDYSLVHLSPTRNLDQLAAYCNGTNCLYNIFHINQVFALRRKFNQVTHAILGDYFDKQRVNADYARDIDKAFSSDCFFFQNEGFKAFSDFQTIGSDWVEGGWTPVAVVIHLTYKDPASDEIRIRHFVSDSSDQDLDIAGRFHEALKKLIDFADDLQLQSKAIDEFRTIYNNGSYHGLGTVKKLSIMHHIELMQNMI